MKSRLRGLIGRAQTRPITEAERWRQYLRAVEPGVAAAPRVHRFAATPQIGSEQTPPAPLKVWIEGPGQAAERTVVALEAGSVAPVEIRSGEPFDLSLEGRCDHIVLLRAGDEPAPLALERLGQAVTLAGDAAVITCDEDQLDGNGSRRAPRFRPGPSPDRWLAGDDSGSLLVISRDRAAAVRAELRGGPAWRHELALGLAGPDGAGHAHVPALLCHRQPGAGEPAPLADGAVQQLLVRWEGGARVTSRGGVRWIRRAVSDEPSVEVIVCLRDKPELLERCAYSVLERSGYERLRLALVDNGSREPATRELLGRLEQDPRVRLLRDERPFNFAALNNAAARGSTADVLVFLNNDTEVVEAGWIEILLEEALRPGVGAVAPLLLYPDGKVQHAGAAIGLHGYAGHPFAGLSPSAQTPFGVAEGGTRNWLAVTAACMMVQRTKFEEVGQFDESFVVAGNDVELCLRLTRAGHRSLCVPHARLVHDESRSRGSHIDTGDFVRSEESYGEFRTLGDPFYNPNLTLRATDCGVRLPGEGGV